MQKNSLFGLSHYGPRVPYQLPMVTAHRIRDMKLHPTAGMVIVFHEDVAPLVLNPEWVTLMKPQAGQYLVTAPRGGTLLMSPAQLHQLFKRKETPNVRNLDSELLDVRSTSEPAGSGERQCSGGCADGKHCSGR